MEFRPCIDIHNGKVKQIVGASLQDEGNRAEENFVAEQNADFFAALYKSAGIKGGHVILLNPADSEYYGETKQQALGALRVYPGGLQAGGGITPDNAWDFLEAGASHVIVTSFVFRDGRIHYDKLQLLRECVGRKRLVLDLSCRKVKGRYRIVTDRWQKITEEILEETLLERLAAYCDEFLVHAVDVEGKTGGIEEELIHFLGKWGGLPITYAGGVQSYGDLHRIRELGGNRVHVTVGSAMDLFGGNLSWKEIAKICDKSTGSGT